MKATSNAKTRRRQNTASLIQQIIAQLRNENAKITISSVAQRAGVTPALIHNTYPDLAEQIRGICGKTIRAQRNAKHAALVKEKEKNSLLHTENSALKMEIAKLASVNLKLLAEMAILKGMASGKVVMLLRQPLNES